MAMYYLARGGDVTGPHAEGRLLQMEDAGEIGPADQLAMHGTEDWLPAADVLAPIRAEVAEKADLEAAAKKRKIPPAQRKRKRSAVRFLFSLSLVIVGFALFLGGVLSFNLLGILLGPIVILLSLVIDELQYECGKCGNRVEKKARLCPACQSPLVAKRRQKRGPASITARSRRSTTSG